MYVVNHHLIMVPFCTFMHFFYILGLVLGYRLLDILSGLLWGTVDSDSSQFLWQPIQTPGIFYPPKDFGQQLVSLGLV